MDYQPGIVLSCTFFHMSWKGKITGIKAAVGMLNLSDHWKIVLCSLSLVLFFFFYSLISNDPTDFLVSRSD